MIYPGKNSNTIILWTWFNAYNLVASNTRLLLVEYYRDRAIESFTDFLYFESAPNPIMETHANATLYVFIRVGSIHTEWSPFGSWKTDAMFYCLEVNKIDSIYEMRRRKINIYKTLADCFLNWQPLRDCIRIYRVSLNFIW